MSAVLFCHPLPYSLEAVSLTEPEARLAAKSNPPVATSLSAGVTGMCAAMPDFLHECWKRAIGHFQLTAMPVGWSAFST